MGRMRSGRVFAVLLAALAAVGIAQLGQNAPALLDNPHIRAALEAIQIIESHYYKELDEEQKERLYEGAVRGVVGALGDPYTSYTPPKRRQIREEDLAGEFYGIGVMIQAARPDGTGAKIIAVFRGGPAYRAGLKAGDEIVEVNGEDVTHLDLFEIVSRIRGPKGTVVEIGVRREGSRAILRFKIPREKIEIVSVSKAKLTDEIGYVAIETFFNRKVNEQLKKAITALKEEGIKKLVLDLRDNSGGLLDQGCAVADAFLKEGTIVYIRSRGVVRPHCEAKPETLWSGPMVVLTNGNSASASEVVAGALKDLKRAPIIGEKTFGKGVGQHVFDLANGGELTVTTFEWLTPLKRTIHEKGITPDYEVRDTRFPEPFAAEGLGAPPGGEVEIVVKDASGRVVKRFVAEVDEEGHFAVSEEPKPRPVSEVPGEALVDLEHDAILKKAIEVLKETP